MLLTAYIDEFVESGVYGNIIGRRPEASGGSKMLYCLWDEAYEI
jgi:hypothetical protein